MLKSYRELKVWQRSIEMTLATYNVTQLFPREELFGLTNQMRRAAVGIASNIAEGYGRNSKGEYKQFLGIARGSNLELQTQLFIAKQLGYGNAEQITHAEDLSNEVAKMLNVLIAKL
jgi:four helix bundle protein